VSSGRNFDEGFSFEVSNGRQQMVFGVTYDKTNQKFLLKCKTHAFGATNGMPMGDVIHSEQTMLIDERRARVLLNTEFWLTIALWAEGMKEKLK
jgi:hypothetical protein